MLKVDMNVDAHGRGAAKIETGGSMEELLAELTFVVVSVYQSTKKAEPMLADVFRDCYVSALRDPDIWDFETGGRGHSMCTIVPNIEK